MEKEVEVVELGKRTYKFSYQPFDASVDMDELTIIHYDNLLGEIITIPTLMNRVGILKAEAENVLRDTKLSHKILEAEKGDYYRKILRTGEPGKWKLPTVSQVEDAVIQDQSVISSQMNLYKVQKNAEIIDSLYWAVKSKEMKLSRISEGITPEDFEKEILEGSINSVMIKSMKKKF